MCPCNCLQSPETTFSPRLTLKKRLVNHILGLSPRPQSVSVPADYSDCESPVLRGGSARPQRPLSWACVCSLQQRDSASLAGNKNMVLHLVHWQLSDEGWKCWAALFMHRIKKWNSLIKCCLAFAFTALFITLQRWMKWKSCSTAFSGNRGSVVVVSYDLWRLMIWCLGCFTQSVLTE